MKRFLVTGLLCLAFAALVWAVYLDRSLATPRAGSPEPAVAAGRTIPDAAQPSRVDAGRAEAPSPPRTPAVVVGDVVLTGILLFADGAPVTDAHCAWSIQGANGSESGQTLTDRDGRFRIPGATRIRGEPRMLRIRARWDDVEKPWGHAETAIPSAYPAGEHDIGFLETDVLPLLASGRVTDVAGAPVLGAQVYAMPAQIDLATLNDEGHAERLSGLTNAQGRFAVHGSLAGETVLLVARRTGYYQPGPVTARVGEREVRVDLAAAGALAGSVLVTDGMSMQHLFIELSGPAVVGHLGAEMGPLPASARPRAEGESLRVPMIADGTFEVGMLRPGSVDCAVRCIGLAEPVAKFDFVRVDAGEIARDPRLQAIDLRALRILMLTIVDATGHPIEGTAIGVRDVGKSAWERQVTGRGGRVAAATAVGAIDVLVQQDGLERQLIPDVRFDRSITIGRGLPAVLAFELGDQQPEFEVTVQLVGTGADRSPAIGAVDVPRSAVQVVESGSPIYLRVPESGAYRLEVTVRARGGPAIQAWKTQDLEPLQVEVPAGGSATTVQVKLAKDAIGKAVRQIRYFFPTAGIVR